VKHLPKHFRPRWRYLAVEIETWPDATLDRGRVQRELWYAAQNLVGDAGSAALDLTVVSFEYVDATGSVVVRVHRGEVDRARAVVATVDEVDGQSVGVRVAGVSGTVRACEEKYIRRRPEHSEQRDVVFGNAERSAVVWNGRADLRRDEAFTGATTLDLH
jgi:ribonuclease P/MRP protein subunit POP5